MKLVPALLVLAAAGLGYVAWSGGGQPVEAWQHPESADFVGDVPPGYVLMRFDVEGMCCRSCPQKLQAELAELDGVRSSGVRFETKSADLVVPAGYDPAPALAVLNQGKYTATPAPSDGP